MALDHRLNAFREDLADERLASVVAATRYTAGVTAWIRVGCASVRRTPDDQALCETFAHYGERVCVFERGEKYAWCQSYFDGYVGFIRNEHIDCSMPEGTKLYITTMGSYIYDIPDMKHPPDDFLPRHAQVGIVASNIVTRDITYLQMDNGRYLPASCVSDTPPSSPDLVTATEKYLGCPYLWGGRSFLGIDCSGLIQSAFSDLGTTVLRDADMQREALGKIIHVEGAYDLERGDLLFPSDHVVVYDGAGSVIHADGKTMIVQRQGLSQMMDVRNVGFSDMLVRRTTKLHR